METYESVTRDEATAALASVRDSRRRMAWRGYPAWYWPATGAAFGALAYTASLSGWLAAATTIPVAAALIIITLAAGRARGVCEGWAGGAARQRERIVLYGPAALVFLAGTAASRYSSWPPAATAALLFTLFAATGLSLTARAARQ